MAWIYEKSAVGCSSDTRMLFAGVRQEELKATSKSGWQRPISDRPIALPPRL